MMSLRSLLGVPFRVSKNPNKVTGHLAVLGHHYPVLRARSVPSFEDAVDRMRAQRWHLRQFVYFAEGSILLDTGLGWALSGVDLLAQANWHLVDQFRDDQKP